ncbi:MAG: nuclear transport factor 2 family protein [Steroidobacteraceae bacterium]
MRNELFVLIVSAAVTFPATAAEPTEAERAVWQLEEDYWRYVRAGDVETYVQLWHEDFVGWPCHSKTPSDKSGIGTWVREIRDNHWKLDYTLRPLEARTFGDVVVVHYAAEYVYDYGDGTRSGAGLWRKFTHTWKKSDGRWQIITGMCAAQEPVVAPRS